MGLVAVGGLLPRLAAPAALSASAVSFHGIGGNDKKVLIGRAPDPLKNEIRTAIRKRVKGLGVRVVTSGPYAATSERNFVNWLTAGGSKAYKSNRQRRPREPLGGRR